MPSISAPAKILVTGGSGLIGAWVVKDLLARGFSVLAAYVHDTMVALLYLTLISVFVPPKAEKHFKKHTPIIPPSSRSL